MKIKKKLNITSVMIVGIIAIAVLYFYSMNLVEKQVPHPADLTGEDQGTLTIRMRDEEGNEGDMLSDFYKITGIVGSIIQGATTVSCNNNNDCLSKCSGDNFCNQHIQCFIGKCTYGLGASGIKITQLALDGSGTNTGTSPLEVTFDYAVDDKAKTKFTTSHTNNVNLKQTTNPGETAVYRGDFFDIADYEGLGTITFAIGMHAQDLYDVSKRYPTSGSIEATVKAIISSDPTGGFSVSISQLPGLTSTTTTSTASSVNICYQEFANTANPCGGLATGTYTCSGAFHTTFVCANAYDGDYSTRAEGGSGTNGEVLITYAIPTNAKTTSLWQARLGLSSIAIATNYTIPADCWTNPLNFKIVSNNWKSPYGVDAYCLTTGNAWKSIFSQSGITEVWEEGMTWVY